MIDDKIEWGTRDHLRAHLRGYLGTLFSGGAGVAIKKDGRIFFQGKPFAVAKYFQGIDAPLFAFVQPEMEYWLQNATNRTPHRRFELTLSRFGQPRLLVTGEDVTEELVKLITTLSSGAQVIHSTLRIIDNSPAQIEVEFWEPKFAPGWIKMLNDEYKPPEIKPLMETRQYPAAWEGKQVFYVQGGDTFVVDVKTSVEIRILGTAEIEEGRLTMFRYDNNGSEHFSEVTANVPRLLPKGQ